MPMSTRNKNLSIKLSTNQSVKKSGLGGTTTALGYSHLNDTSKLSTSSNKTNVSSLVSPSRKFLHKKNPSDIFQLKDKVPKGLPSGRTSPKVRK